MWRTVQRNRDPASLFVPGSIINTVKPRDGNNAMRLITSRPDRTTEQVESDRIATFRDGHNTRRIITIRLDQSDITCDGIAVAVDQNFFRIVDRVGIASRSYNEPVCTVARCFDGAGIETYGEAGFSRNDGAPGVGAGSSHRTRIEDKSFFRGENINAMRAPAML